MINQIFITRVNFHVQKKNIHATLSWPFWIMCEESGGLWWKVSPTRISSRLIPRKINVVLNAPLSSRWSNTHSPLLFLFFFFLFFSTPGGDVSSRSNELIKRSSVYIRACVSLCVLSDDEASLVPVKLMALVNQTRRSNELVTEP